MPRTANSQLRTPHSQLRTPNSSRHGLSLLEILFAVFVLMVGLLGVAAMIPVGHFRILQAAKAERSAACGRAALAEMQVRAWLDPEIWLAPNCEESPDATYVTPPGSIPYPTTRYRSVYALQFNPPNATFVNDDLLLYPATTTPRYWFLPVSAPYQNQTNLAPNELIDHRRSIHRRDSFAIDPLFCARNQVAMQDPNVPVGFRKFPFASSAAAWTIGPVATDATWAVPAWTMPRVTIDVNPRVLPDEPPYFGNWDAMGNWIPDPKTNPMPAAVAASVFTWHDDQLVSVPSDPGERPRQNLLWQNGLTAPYPDRPLLDGAGVDWNQGDRPLSRQYEGAFSWMAVVTPLSSEPDYRQLIDQPPNNPFNTWSPGCSYTDTISRYQVSIVVFHKRGLDLNNGVLNYPLWFADLDNYWQDLAANPPQERVVGAHMDGDGWGGGDVTLVANAPPPSTGGFTVQARDAIQNAWLILKESDWIMLMGPDGNIQGPGTRMVYKWYRVIAVDEITDEDILGNNNGALDAADDINGNSQLDQTRRVTLAGPDWRVDTDGGGQIDPAVDTDGNGETDLAGAALVDDIAGVYTTTVEVGR